MTQHILFLCDHNTVRSPMAAALMRRRDKASDIKSAGLSPDDAVDPFAVGTLMDEGIDIAGHTPAPVSPDAISPDTLVIALTVPAFEAARKWRTTSGFELDYWDLPEVPAHDGPRSMVAEGYRAIREAIKSHIANRFGAQKP